MGKIPLNTVKNIISDYWEGDISQECVNEVSGIISNFIDMLIREGVNEFKDYNGRRQLQGLPELKRLQGSVFLKLSDELFNQLPDFNIGETGLYNSETVFSTEAVEVV